MTRNAFSTPVRQNIIHAFRIVVDRQLVPLLYALLAFRTLVNLEGINGPRCLRHRLAPSPQRGGGGNSCCWYAPTLEIPLARQWISCTACRDVRVPDLINVTSFELIASGFGSNFGRIPHKLRRVLPPITHDHAG